MKNKIIVVAICLSLVLSFFVFSQNKAFADPFTVSQIASGAYAFMSGAGITFTAGSASASGMNNFMSQQIESYVNHRGGTLADVFVGQMAVDVAGKLAMTYDMYNSMRDFVGWLKDKYTLTAEDLGLTDGEYEGTFIPTDEIQGGTEITGVGIEASFSGPYVMPDGKTGYQRIAVYNNGALITQYSLNYIYKFGADYSVFHNNGMAGVYAKVYYSNSGAYSQTLAYNAGTVTLDNSLAWHAIDDWSMPAVLYPDKEWTGTVGGYSAPDTNLDQLLGDIDQAVADNNLVVEGEVIDIPVPTPTPMPIDPDTPLQDVPWEGLDNNLQQLYEQGLEEIGTIGEARDAITDAVGEQTGALEDAIADNAGVVSGAIDQAVSDVEGAIADNAGVVSGAIDQAVSDVQDAIGEQTAALDESLSATAEGVETIAEAIEDEEINWRKFDLRGLFPFCIPFDIYNMLNALDASPTAPHVQIPFVIQSLGFSYLIDLDFSAFDSVAAIMRQMEFICYGLALAWATSKVIKW